MLINVLNVKCIIVIKIRCKRYFISIHVIGTCMSENADDTVQK